MSASPARLGVNVVGYHHVDSGLGFAARSIVSSLEAAGVVVTAIDVPATDSPARRGAVAPGGPLHDVTIAVVTALELPAVAELIPEPFAGGRLRIGYWFWELAVVPADQAPAFEFIDAIWAPTKFVADAYRSAGDTPVELQALHLAEPACSQATRADLGLPDQFTFLVSFDHLSVVERKNPTTAIAAFREAFPDRDDVTLVVKSINGERKPVSMRQVVDASGGDPRIHVVDRYVDAADHAAMIRHADCFVSLHRGEGLGLNLAEAMWLGTPVIATRYSGNLDFMDDDSAALVDASLTPVLHGEGAYPEGELWAEPNILQATGWMRKLRDEPEVGERLAKAALQAMHSQPTSEDVGRRMAAALAKRAANRPATAPTGVVRGGGRRVARAAAAPMRNYVNQHFELTKQELRDQVAQLARRHDEALAGLGENDRLADTIESLANSVAEVHVHQTRLSVRQREEIEALRQEIAELRRDLNGLTAVLVSMLEQPEPT